MKLEDIKIVDQNLMSNVTDYDDYSKLDIAIGHADEKLDCVMPDML